VALAKRSKRKEGEKKELERLQSLNDSLMTSDDIDEDVTGLSPA
jgi:hypothetical protein